MNSQVQQIEDPVQRYGTIKFSTFLELLKADKAISDNIFPYVETVNLDMIGHLPTLFLKLPNLKSLDVERNDPNSLGEYYDIIEDWIDYLNEDLDGIHSVYTEQEEKHELLYQNMLCLMGHLENFIYSTPHNPTIVELVEKLGLDFKRVSVVNARLLRFAVDMFKLWLEEGQMSKSTAKKIVTDYFIRMSNSEQERYINLHGPIESTFENIADDSLVVHNNASNVITSVKNFFMRYKLFQK